MKQVQEPSEEKKESDPLGSIVSEEEKKEQLLDQQNETPVKEQALIEKSPHSTSVAPVTDTPPMKKISSENQSVESDEEVAPFEDV